MNHIEGFISLMRQYDTPLNEPELILQLQNGNETAFRWLVGHYRNRIYHTVLNILQDTREAEDASQETFIQVFESIGQFKQESSLATWIYRIATRKAIDRLRKRKTRKRIQQILPWWMPGEKNKEAEFFDHPGIAAENKEKAAILFKAVESLPEKQRLAFTLIKIQGMSYEEACTIMEQNIKAVESLISRAKQKLQKELGDYYRKLNEA